MSYIMYVCPICRKIYKINGIGKKAKCPKCTESVLVDTSIEEDVWKIYSPDKRNDIISGLLDEPEIIEVMEEQKEVISDEKKKDEQTKDAYASFFDIPANDNTRDFFSMQNSLEPASVPNIEGKQGKPEPKITQEEVKEKKKHSTLSIVGLILSIIGCSSIIGLVIDIIDLVRGKNDDNKHVLSKVGIGFAAAYFVIGIVLTMIGIGSGGTSLESAKPLEMVDYGWYFDPPSVYDDTVYVEYCGIIHNPNEKLIAEFPKLIVTIKNPDGTILATGDQTGSIIMPGDTITLCGMFPMPISNASDQTQININWECDDFNTVSKLHEAVSSKELVVSNVSEHSGSDENFITGEVTNSSMSNLDMVNVSMVLRKNGKIVYMENTFVDNLPSGSTKAFEFRRYEHWVDHDKIECSAMVW